MVLRLGLIGLSQGNGHPYSWSAIFNGYDLAAMEDCGFPVIPRYLEKQTFPDDAISGARVTHVWAQERAVAEHIAKAGLIDNVVHDYRDMIGEIDALLLARDDAETHDQFAAPFLDAGIPIYIDKPLALSLESARKILSRQQYPGQVFSCSALKYASELMLSEQELQQLGRIRLVQATVPKDWDRYAIHAIDPILLLAAPHGPIIGAQVARYGDVTCLTANYRDGLVVQVTATGSVAAPIGIRFHGDEGWTEKIFKESFPAFRAALYDFVQGVTHRDVRSAPESMLAAVALLEAGRQK